MSFKPALLPDDPVALKALVVQLHDQNTALSATVRAFEQRITTLKSQAFRRASGKIERAIEQLELALEDLLIAKTGTSPSPAEGGAQADTVPEREPRGQTTVLADMPREPDFGTACSDRGRQLRRVGQDVSAVLDMIIAQLNAA